MENVWAVARLPIQQIQGNIAVIWRHVSGHLVNTVSPIFPLFSSSLTSEKNFCIIIFSPLNSLFTLLILLSIFPRSSSSSSSPSPLSADSFSFLVLYLFNPLSPLKLSPSPSLLSYLMISLRSRIIITQLSCHVGSPRDPLEMCVAIVLVKNWTHPLVMMLNERLVLRDLLWCMTNA